MSRILFAGGRLETLVVATGAPSDVTTAGRFDPAYADASLSVSPGDLLTTELFDAAMTPTTVSAGHTLWLHLDVHGSGGFGGSYADPIIFRGADGYPYVKVRSRNSPNEFAVYGNTGTGAAPVWTLLGSVYPSDETLHTWDISIAIDAGGNHTVATYRDATATDAGGAFAQADLVDIATVDFGAWNDSYGWNISQILATEDASTVGGHVSTIRGTGTGAHAEWAGDVSDVNQALDNDTTANTADSAGLLQTYAMGAVTLPDGYQIPAVFHWLRAKNTGGVPSNVQSIARQSGVDHTGGDMPTVGLGYAPAGARYDADPGTSVAWTEAGVNSLELGYGSAA